MGVRTPTAAAKMYQVSSFLCFFCFALVTVPTGVDATCEWITECFNTYNYSTEDTGLNLNSASELESYCQTFGSVRACVNPELSTCDQEPLVQQWVSRVNPEQFLCSSEGRQLFLASSNCLETSQDVSDAGQACFLTYSAALLLVDQQKSSGYYNSAEAENRDKCRAMDDYYNCSCNAVRPACGQDAATFFHMYLVKTHVATWNSIGCPALYGSPSCSDGSQGGNSGGPNNTAGQITKVLAWKLLAAVLLLARI